MYTFFNQHKNPKCSTIRRKRRLNSAITVLKPKEIPPIKSQAGRRVKQMQIHRILVLAHI